MRYLIEWKNEEGERESMVIEGDGINSPMDAADVFKNTTQFSRWWGSSAGSTVNVTALAVTYRTTYREIRTIHANTERI